MGDIVTPSNLRQVIRLLREKNPELDRECSFLTMVVMVAMGYDATYEEFCAWTDISKEEFNKVVAIIGERTL